MIQDDFSCPEVESRHGGGSAHRPGSAGNAAGPSGRLRRYGGEYDRTGGSEGRAEAVLAYIRGLLRHTDEVELWHICMGMGERPLIPSKTIPISQLRAEELGKLEERDLWEDFYGIPIQYRLVIQK